MSLYKRLHEANPTQAGLSAAKRRDPVIDELRQNKDPWIQDYFSGVRGYSLSRDDAAARLLRLAREAGLTMHAQAELLLAAVEQLAGPSRH